MEKTDRVNQDLRAIALLLVLGGFLFWAVWICVGLFDSHLGLGERLAFILGAPFVFVIMALVGGPPLLWIILSANGSANQSPEAKQLVDDIGLLCALPPAYRFFPMLALLRDACLAQPMRQEPPDFAGLSAAESGDADRDRNGPHKKCSQAERA